MSRQAGVYAIRNTRDGRVYIGSSVDFIRRLSDHRKHLTSGKHKNIFLQRAWDKYGPAAFLFCVVVEVADESELRSREQSLIDGTPHHMRYNINPRADVPPAQKGRTYGAATRAKMSIASRASVRTPEWCANISAAVRGRVKSEAHRLKLSQAQKGKPRPLSAASAASKSSKLKGNRNSVGGNRDIQKTQEYRRRMSAIKSGRSVTEGEVVK